MQVTGKGEEGWVLDQMEVFNQFFTWTMSKIAQHATQFV
jgi:hypothetical protein